jgi:polyhydroxyalkanoate synthesis repressor PhaR
VETTPVTDDTTPSSGPSAGQSKPEQSRNATVIKKYANRRLYNTATSTYVTLEDLARMVKEGADFIVYDAKSGEDITRSVLTQIIFEEENKGDNNLLPINFLRQLIRFYGDSMQGVVPGYLEFSLGNLMKEQDKVRKQMMDAFGGDAFKTMEGRRQAQHAAVPGFSEDVHALWRRDAWHAGDGHWLPQSLRGCQQAGREVRQQQPQQG